MGPVPFGSLFFCSGDWKNLFTGGKNNRNSMARGEEMVSCVQSHMVSVRHASLLRWGLFLVRTLQSVQDGEGGRVTVPWRNLTVPTGDQGQQPTVIGMVMVVPLPLGSASQTHNPSLIKRKMSDQSQLRDMLQTPDSAPQNCRSVSTNRTGGETVPCRGSKETRQLHVMCPAWDPETEKTLGKNGGI